MVLQTSRLQFAGRISSPKHHNGDSSVVDITVESCISPVWRRPEGTACRGVLQCAPGALAPEVGEVECWFTLRLIKPRLFTHRTDVRLWHCHL